MVRRDLTVRHATEIRSFPHRDTVSHTACGIEGLLWPRTRVRIAAHTGSADATFRFGAKGISRLPYDYRVRLHSKNASIAMNAGARHTQARSVSQSRALEVG